jgi:hypothetical protein
MRKKNFSNINTFDGNISLVNFPESVVFIALELQIGVHAQEQNK